MHKQLKVRLLHMSASWDTSSCKVHYFMDTLFYGMHYFSIVYEQIPSHQTIMCTNKDLDWPQTSVF